MDNIERDTQALLEDEEFNQNKNEVFLYLEQLARRYLSEWMKSYKK